MRMAAIGAMEKTKILERELSKLLNIWRKEGKLFLFFTWNVIATIFRLFDIFHKR